MDDRDTIFEFSKLKLNWNQLMEEIGNQLKDGFMFYIKGKELLLILMSLKHKIRQKRLDHDVKKRYKELYSFLKEIVDGKDIRL